MSEYPEKLKPFFCHGVELDERQNGNWVGDCPFCGKPGHFFASPKSGLWDCKVCGESGNPVSFLTKYAKQSYRDTPRDSWRKLVKLRGLPAGVMKKRQVSNNGNGTWLIPVVSEEGTVRDIRRWNGKVMKSTLGCKTQLFGADRLAKSRATARVWLCEGEWDAMAMDWLLRELGSDPRDEVAVAVPGATVFKSEWSHLFEHRRVVACYDADDAGERGEVLAKQRLQGVAGSMEFIRWPDQVPKGFDLRDFIRRELADDGDPHKALGTLLGLVRGEPKLEVAISDEMPSFRAKEGGPAPQSFQELLDTFREEVAMGPDMEQALLISLAVALSNDLRSTDPLWVYLVAPPSSGKTLLLASLQSSGRCVFRSTVTPHCLVSGWRGEGGDPSLIPKLKGRTFVTKDFTEILTLPPTQQDEIFSTLRGAYDGNVTKTFGNGITREYKNCWFSMLAGVTPAIHSHEKASLGERFLKFAFRPFSVKHQTRLIGSALASIGQEQEKEEALQEAVARFLDQKVTVKELPRFNVEMTTRITALVQLTAFMRAQVDRDPRNGDIRYRPAPEVGSRLVKQLGKLAMLVSYIKGESKISEESYRLVERVAFDTATGFHLDVVTAMMEKGGTASKQEVCEICKLPSSTLSRRFEDLQVLRAIEPAGTRDSDGGRPSKLWTVTAPVAALWKEARGQVPRTRKKPRKKGKV